MKLCAKGRKISCQEVPLIAVRDQTHNTLKLALTTNNKVVEVGRNLYDLPIPDLVHFHKQTGDIMFIDLLKTTLNLSKMVVTKRKIENHVRQ